MTHTQIVVAIIGLVLVVGLSFVWIFTIAHIGGWRPKRRKKK